MVPGIIVRITLKASRAPVLGEVVPDIPFVCAPSNSALMAPDETHAVEKLVEVKFECLRSRKVISEEIYVIHKTVNVGNNSVTGVRQSLGRAIADQMIVKEHIPVRTAAPHVVLRRITAEGGISDSLGG